MAVLEEIVRPIAVGGDHPPFGCAECPRLAGYSLYDLALCLHCLKAIDRRVEMVVDAKVEERLRNHALLVDAERRREVDADLAARDQRQTAGVVYYVRRGDGAIKIGTTTNLTKRVRALTKEHGPVEVLATHPGGFRAEQSLHRTFAASRLDGEWFEESHDLAVRIDRYRGRQVPA